MKLLKNSILKKSIFVLVISIALLTCNSFKTALYDQYSYERSISLKVDALELMNEATEPYAEHVEEVKTYLVEFQKLKEYEKNKANNELSYEMIKLIGNPEKNLLGGFFKRWKEKNTISKIMIGETKGQIGEAFDILIKYEAKKNKENKDEITQYLSK